MIRLSHRPAFDGSFSHNGEEYRIKDGVIEVENPEVAKEMAEHPRIEIAEVEETPTPEPEETTFRCGVNDCSREVDSKDATCWQH
jgi:hypothetical protein